MPKLKLALAAAAALSLTAGCDGRSDPPADTRAIQQQLRAQEAQWQSDYASRDVSRLESHYAAGGTIASPGAPLATDPASRRAALEPLTRDPNLHMEFASDQVRVARSGDLAYTRGRFTMRSTDPASGQPRTDRGTYITVWEKQQDGSWKAVEDFVTPGPATAG